ncbi:type II toxin-antitoxin system prevent-host-death family antitoxin [Boseaceae bacterium BT-24-1]|nr:type II toxin-antitoxin system prevent-host-death family antitoxin [Boseaceae bacterium BT-24-1]
MVKTVSAAEANREFSKLMKLAERGERVVVTSRGQPKVQITRVEEADSEKAQRREAFDRLTERLNSQPAQNLPRLTRDDFYD